MIDQKKLALVHLAKKNLAMHDDDYRALLRRAGGVDSAKDLDPQGFAAVMVEFGKLGFESTAASEKRKEPQRASGHATYAQCSYIRRLWQDYKGEDDEPGLRRWLQHKFKVSHPRFLDADTVRKVIFALQNFKPKGSQTNA
ncbi:MAG: regulatory protein GemA [Azonexus sp.]|nr:regulatory protein GemA [Azonexus sp.]